MAPEIISLVTSSPELPPAAPSNPRKRLSGGAGVGDKSPSPRQPEKRPRQASPSGAPRRSHSQSFLDALDFSDLSDPLDLSDLIDLPRPAKQQQHHHHHHQHVLSRAAAVPRGPPLPDPRSRFERTSTPPPATRTGFGPRTRRVAAFDDPIELSSTPDPVPQRKSAGRATTAADRISQHDIASDPFSISPSPERRRPAARGTSSARDDAGPSWRRTLTPPRRIHRHPSPILSSPIPIATTSTSKPTSRHPRDWDPISSSAPESQRHPQVIDLDSEGESPNPLPSDDSFPDLEDILAAPRRTYHSPIARPARPKARTGLQRASSYTPLSTTTANATIAGPPLPRKKTAEERARHKEARAAAREADKARKKQEREEARARKERAAALAEVNKVRTDKKISATEMIVDLPSSLDGVVALQARELLVGLGIENATWESPVAGVVRWRRKVRSEFRPDRGHYEPVAPRVEEERFALAVVPAGELAEGAGADLGARVGELRRHFPDYELIYLVEGMDPWLRRNRALRNRRFAAAVRAAADPPPAAASAPAGPSSSSRRGAGGRAWASAAAAAAEYVDEEVVENALLELQVRHGVKIHHTAAGIETAQWIVTFTQHISTVPYRRRRDEANASAAAFCMDSGQVRSGADARDVYVRLLQEMARVTAPVAYGVAAEFGTVGELVRGLERGGPLALAECRKGMNREGELGDRSIGQAISRRIYKVFTGRDENSMDV